MPQHDPVPARPEPWGAPRPERIAHPAWDRLRTFVAWMIAVAGAAVAAVLLVLDWQFGAISAWTKLAVVLGVGGTVAMAGALMGLVFASSRAGHDEAVDRRDGID